MNAGRPPDRRRVERVYLALGSNIEPESNLRRAAAELRARFPVAGNSSVWRTPPVGGPAPDYLNAVIAIETSLSVRALKYGVLRPLEAAMGRVRRADRNAPRVIDIDPLVRGQRILDPEIWIHPHLAVPLAELLPGLPHPETGLLLGEAALALRRAAPLERLALDL